MGESMLGARERALVGAMRLLAERVPNARDWERPSGFSDAYQAHEYVMDVLGEALEAVRASIREEVRRYGD